MYMSCICKYTDALHLHIYIYTYIDRHSCLGLRVLGFGVALPRGDGLGAFGLRLLRLEGEGSYLCGHLWRLLKLKPIVLNNLSRYYSTISECLHFKMVVRSCPSIAYRNTAAHLDPCFGGPGYL